MDTIKEIAYLNVLFYDENNNPILFCDGFSGIAYCDEDYIQIQINKMLKQTPYFNGKGDGTFNDTHIEEQEFDFSEIPDETWLKLKKVKKIIMDTNKQYGG